jgi:hypothetical protein
MLAGEAAGSHRRASRGRAFPAVILRCTQQYTVHSTQYMVPVEGCAVGRCCTLTAVDWILCTVHTVTVHSRHFCQRAPSGLNKQSKRARAHYSFCPAAQTLRVACTHCTPHCTHGTHARGHAGALSLSSLLPACQLRRRRLGLAAAPHYCLHRLHRLHRLRCIILLPLLRRNPRPSSNKSCATALRAVPNVPPAIPHPSTLSTHSIAHHA